LLVGGGLGLIALFQFNPAEHHFFPRCAFHVISGWDCPGCGGQRALHYLLHGNLGAAVRHNALLIALLPVGGGGLARSLWRHWSGRAGPALFHHHWWPWLLCGLVIGFGVVRNLPGFGWLRP
jgi:hypothetical protein